MKKIIVLICALFMMAITSRAEDIIYTDYGTSLSANERESLIDFFFDTNSDRFRTEDLLAMKLMVKNMTDEQLLYTLQQNYKSPIGSVIVSVIFGALGADRFYIGDFFAGVVKLCTAGGFGVWYVIDWILIYPATQDRNFELFCRAADRPRFHNPVYRR